MSRTLKDKITLDFKNALARKEEAGIRTLRLLNAAILNKQKEKRYKLSKQNLSEADLEKQSQLIDEELLQVIASETKKRKESISAFEKGGRPDLVQREKEELAVLECYLPLPLPDEELRQIVTSAIKELGAKGPKESGKVMAKIIPQIKGRADGQKVSVLVKSALSGNS